MVEERSNERRPEVSELPAFACLKLTEQRQSP
jgi:hypothetical protein